MADQNDADPEIAGSAALTPEDIKLQLQERFLTPSNKLPKHWLKDWQMSVVTIVREMSKKLRRHHRYWPFEPDLDNLYFAEPARPTTTLEFQTVGLEGRIRGYKEVRLTSARHVDAV